MTKASTILEALVKCTKALEGIELHCERNGERAPADVQDALGAAQNAIDEAEEQGQRTKLYDVVEVDLDTNQVRVIAKNNSKDTAGSIVRFAIGMGVLEAIFYAYVSAGKYKDGDRWESVDD